MTKGIAIFRNCDFIFVTVYVEDILQGGKFKRDFGKYQEEVNLDDAKGDHLNK